MRVRSEIGKVRGDVGWKSTYCVVVTPTCIDGIVQHNALFVYNDQNSRYNGDRQPTKQQHKSCRVDTATKTKSTKSKQPRQQHNTCIDVTADASRVSCLVPRDS